MKSRCCIRLCLSWIASACLVMLAQVSGCASVRVYQMTPYCSPVGGASLLYLTWRNDPCHTMVVQWLTEGEDAAWVQYRTLARTLGDREEWQGVSGSATHLDGGLFLQRVELEGLAAGEEYELMVGRFPAIERFHTLPEELSRPLRVVLGGDCCGKIELLREMNELAAREEPDFVLLGGDLAYSGRRMRLFVRPYRELEKWVAFFAEWTRSMRGEDGHLIPMVVVLGNHDLNNWEHQEVGKGAPLFYQFFPFPEEQVPLQSYRTLDCGNYLSFLLLDSEHTHPVAGAQTLWLKQAFEGRREIPWKVPVYHRSAYPAVYSFNHGVSKAIRSFWCPLFEEHGVKVAFEHHNHTYKRTYPICAEEIDPVRGIVYLGDGCWGVKPRTPTSLDKRWYLAEAQSWNHFFSLVLDEKGLHLETIGRGGLVLERFSFSRGP